MIKSYFNDFKSYFCLLDGILMTWNCILMTGGFGKRLCCVSHYSEGRRRLALLFCLILFWFDFHFYLFIYFWVLFFFFGGGVTGRPMRLESARNPKESKHKCTVTTWGPCWCHCIVIPIIALHWFNWHNIKVDIFYFTFLRFLADYCIWKWLAIYKKKPLFKLLD